jgi:hypothetical protein
MPLLPATLRIIAQVETLSNRPVHISEDATLDTLAKITIARGDAPFHLLRYKPTGSMPPDYFIAYQCGFVVRLYQAPPEKRFDVGSNEEGKRRMTEALSDEKFPREMRDMCDFLLTGLITQLRSYPIGLRVDHWLLESYPELRDLQKRGTQVQLEQNIEAIKMAKKGLFPPKLVKANLTMNAAFALYWSRAWNDASLALPYKAAGFIDQGSKLLAVWDRVSQDAACDMDLIDEWAFNLGLKGWYARVPHILNP